MPSDTPKDRFLQAVEERKHAMYRVALMMLRHPADAEDAVSDAVEATWRRIITCRRISYSGARFYRGCLHQTWI